MCEEVHGPGQDLYKGGKSGFLAANARAAKIEYLGRVLANDKQLV